MKSRWLVLVNAPWCCAGAVVVDGKLTQCAPILRKWLRDDVRAGIIALRKRGAVVEFVVV